jgi:hypothetical protein
MMRGRGRAPHRVSGEQGLWEDHGMSAGHSLRRENYTFTRFDPRFDPPLPRTGHVPGPLAVVMTVSVASTCSFLVMDPAAASWLRHALQALWLLATH